MRHFLTVSWVIFWQNLSSSSAYIANTLSSVGAEFVRTGAIVVVWYVNLDGGSGVTNFSYIFTYYVLGQMLLMSFSYQQMIGADILYGDFSSKLLRPYSVWWGYVWEDVGFGFFAYLTTFITALLIALGGFQWFIIPETWLQGGIFLVSVGLSWVLMSLLSFSLGWMAFFTTNNRGVNALFEQILLVFSGRLIPLGVLGSSFLIWNPFSATFYLPLKIYLESFEVITSLQILGVQLFWIVCIFGLAKELYHRGLQRYESVGL